MFTRELLDLQDEFFIFNDDWLSYENDKYRARCNIITGSYHQLVPSYCKNCSVEWLDSSDFYAHGNTPNKRKIQLTEINGLKTILKLSIPRFMCRHCSSTSSSQLPSKFVLPEQSISRKLYYQVLFDLKKKIAMKDIAKIRNVGYSIVYRTLDKNAKQFKRRALPPLPQVLAIDEFKATNDCNSYMAFIAMDGVTHQLHTLIDDRRIYSLTNHFLQYPHSERIKVKYLVMDMNASYDRLIKVVFPNAKIITDRFHVVQQITRAFNVLRVKEMNKLNRNIDIGNKHYKRLKRF